MRESESEREKERESGLVGVEEGDQKKRYRLKSVAFSRIWRGVGTG